MKRFTNRRAKVVFRSGFELLIWMLHLSWLFVYRLVDGQRGGARYRLTATE